jgi:transposase
MGRSTSQETLLSDKRKYRKFTAKQKVELVLASFRGDRSVAEICREHDLSETLLRRWRDQMIEAGAERFTDGQRQNSTGESQRRNRSNDHHAASDGANSNAEEKGAAQPDRIRD